MGLSMTTVRQAMPSTETSCPIMAMLDKPEQLQSIGTMKTCLAVNVSGGGEWDRCTQALVPHPTRHFRLLKIPQYMLSGEFASAVLSWAISRRYCVVLEMSGWGK